MRSGTVLRLATSLINKKHQEYHTRLKESLYENLDKKTDLCEKVENIAAIDYKTHGAWVEKDKCGVGDPENLEDHWICTQKG